MEWVLVDVSQVAKELGKLWYKKVWVHDGCEPSNNVTPLLVHTPTPPASNH